MISVFYIGDNRHNLDLSRANHQRLFDALKSIGDVNIYDFTKGNASRGKCPFNEGGEDNQLQRGASGAVQVWDFVTSVDKLQDPFVIKMRSDVWLADSCVDVIVSHVKDIVNGTTDIAFFGCDVVNDNQGIEHQAIKITRSDPARIQDFIIAARRSCLPSSQKVIEDLKLLDYNKRVSGNKTFRALVEPDVQAYTVLCHLWLIRKTYHWQPTDSEVFHDFLQSYVQRSGREIFNPAMSWWKTHYRPSIGVFYIGHRRFPEVGIPNHQPLIERLKQLLPVNVYDFSRPLDSKSLCPFDESGANQVWDYMESSAKIHDEYIVKLRTDLWFTPSSIDCMIDGMQRIINGSVDAEFYGSNWAEYLGHERSRFSMQDHHTVQDFAISARKSVLRNKESVYGDLSNYKSSTRACGTKVFKSITYPTITGNNVMCQIYLVRKPYDVVDPWQVGYDYIASYPKQWKMPNALPWYMHTKPND